MKNNSVVIFSFSQLAIQIAQTLQNNGYKIIIVEEENSLILEAKQKGYDVRKISLMDDDNILSLEMESGVKAFFCVSDNKNNNLFVTLSVRNLYPQLKIISVSFTNKDNKSMLLAGANKIINPYEIGALRIFRIFNKPYIVDFLDNILFSKSNIEVSEITIQKNSLLDGVFLQDISLIEEYNLILLGVQDKEIQEKFIFYSSGINHKIDDGDTLVLLGKSDNLQTFIKLLNQSI